MRGESRGAARKQQKRSRIVKVAAVSAALLAVAGVGVFALTVGGDESTSGPKTVSDEKMAADIKAAEAPRAPGHATVKRGAGEDLPSIVLNTNVKIVDTTEDLLHTFSFDAAFLQNLPSEQTIDVTTTPCLQDWVLATLPTLNGDHRTTVEEVCGADMAVIAGGFGTTHRDLLLRTAGNPQLEAVLLGAPSLNYASAATSDGHGVLIVAGLPH